MSDEQGASIPRNRLRELRKARGLTQIEVAAALETEHTTVGRWERSLVPVNTQQMQALADLFGVTPPELFVPREMLATSADEAAALAAFRDMTDEQRAAWLSLLPGAHKAG